RANNMTPRQVLISKNDDILHFQVKYIIATTKVGTSIYIHYQNFYLERVFETEGEAQKFLIHIKDCIEGKIRLGDQ
ncbi:TPA: hypothetical protein ACIXYU_005717, partial [Escherichia coli]